MNRSQKLLKSISEIAYLGGHNQYSTAEYDQDAAEYHRPFEVVSLPDYSGSDVNKSTSFPQTGNFYDWERKKYGAMNKVS